MSEGKAKFAYLKQVAIGAASGVATLALIIAGFSISGTATPINSSSSDSANTDSSASATPTPTPSPAVTIKPVVKKMTIICKKGKTTKKVTALKPSCPKGFKKSP